MEKLQIYQKALDLVVDIYSLIKLNKDLKRDFSLADQLKRASVSVATNISEGYFRTRKLSKYYLKISSGSTNEVVTILKLVERIYQIETKLLQEEYIILGKRINSFSKTF